MARFCTVIDACFVIEASSNVASIESGILFFKSVV